MDRTLAARFFENRPELLSIAESTASYAELTGQLVPMRIDKTVPASLLPDEQVLLGDMELGRPEWNPTADVDQASSFFVVEGDLLLDADELPLYALRREAMRSPDLNDPVPPFPLEPSASLTAISIAGVPARWKDATALSYCVFLESFPDRESYVMVRDNLATAAQDWQSTCGVRFIYHPEFDNHPDPAVQLEKIDPKLVFAVRYLDTGGEVIASAFFPTQPPRRRRVFIDPSYYADSLIYDRVGVLRHELGHILGFRHEQNRNEAPPDCSKDRNLSISELAELTVYDYKSVMHYFCGGVGSREMTITALDVEGAQKLYGPPLDGMEKPMPGQVP